MNKYLRIVIIALAISVALSLWAKHVITGPPAGFVGPIFGLQILFVQFILIPIFLGIQSYRDEKNLKQGLFSFGIFLLVATAVWLVIVLPASITERKERKLRCEQDNERQRISYEMYGPPIRKDGVPVVYTPYPCN